MKNVTIAGDDPVEAVPPYTPGVAAEREMGAALWKGWRRKCPNCGKGPMLSGYLKVRESCPVCREALHHHRADDGPAYLTILIVGHLMAPALLFAFTTWRPEPLVLFTIFAVGTIALSRYLLPRLKGVIVAFQWARRMHGFGAQTGNAKGNGAVSP